MQINVEQFIIGRNNDVPCFCLVNTVRLKKSLHFRKISPNKNFKTFSRNVHVCG